MQPPYQVRYLLQQYLADKATEEERMQLFQALQQPGIDWEELLLQEGLQQERDPAYDESNWTAVIEQIVQQPVRRQKVFFMNRRWMAAAAVLLFVVCGLLFVVKRNKIQPPVTVTTPAVHDIQPGTQGAILTLADGRRVVIDSTGNGAIAQQGNMIVHRKDGQLFYSKQDAESNSNDNNAPAVAYNTLSTPRGRQFELVLPDGSKVWLNAASSIRYPVAFTGNERRVEITGEAYFEVAKAPSNSSGGGGKGIPFIVDILPSTGGVGGGRVEVLGTHFNINAYNDEEAVKTTLLEGKVRLVNGQWSMVNGQWSIGNQQTVILNPGQQASLSQASHNIPVQTVDVDAVVAWKNGLFNFQDVGLQQAMRQLARWYDIDVKYEKGIPDIEFGGKMGRDLTLSNVLHFLEKSGLHFRLENKRTLIVMP